MIKEIKMFECVCDSCGKRWTDENTGIMAMTDESSIEDNALDECVWSKVNGKHYCGSCLDDDGNPKPTTLYCSMEGKGFCQYELKDGVCGIDSQCVNQISLMAKVTIDTLYKSFNPPKLRRLTI